MAKRRSTEKTPSQQSAPSKPTRQERRQAARNDAKAGQTAGGVASSKYLLPILLFFVCFGAYVSNGDFLPGGDQEGNMLLSVNMLKRHAFSLSPPNAPDAFFWELEQPSEKPRGATFNAWNREVNDLYEKGQLKARGIYYLAKTTRPDVYVNAFGIGSAIVGLPVYAFLDLFVDIESDRYWWWHGGALTASLLIASAALFIFLASRRFVAPLRRAPTGASSGSDVRAGQLRVVH